jgi:hypothetical protein
MHRLQHRILVVARLLQEVLAAMVWTVGLALIVITVEKDEVAQSMGIVRFVLGPYVSALAEVL